MIAEGKTSWQSMIRSWRFRIPAGIVVFIALCLLALPLGIKYGAVYWLKQNGAEQAEIKTVLFNPFAGRLTLGGVSVASQGTELLKNSRMVIDLRFTDLFRKEVHLQTAHYKDLYVDLEQFADGNWRYGPYKMVAGEAEPIAEDAALSKEEALNVWGVLADLVLLENCSVHLKTPQLSAQLDIERAELSRFSTVAGRPAAAFSLSGKLNGSPLNIELERLEVLPTLALQGKVKLDGLDLGAFAALLAEVLPQFGGSLALDGSVSFGMADGMKGAYQGGVELEQLQLGMTGLETGAEISLARLKWQGDIDFHQPGEAPLQLQTNGGLGLENLTFKQGDSALTTKLSSLALQGKTSLSSGKTLTAAYDGALRLDQLGLEAADNKIALASLQWKGTNSYSSEASVGEPAVKSKGELQLTGIDVTNSQLSLSDESLSWQGELQLMMGDSATPAVTASAEEDKVAKDGKEGKGGKGGDKEAEAEKVAHTGTSNAALAVQSKTKLDSGGLKLSLAETGMQLSLDTFSLQATLGGAVQPEPKIDARGGVSMSGLAIDAPDEKQQMQALLGIGNLSIDQFISKENGELTVNGVNLKGIQGSVPGDMPLQLALDSLGLSNIRVADIFDAAAGESSVDEVTLMKPQIFSVLSGEQLLGVESLHIKGIHGNGSAVKGDTLSIAGIHLFSSATPGKTDKSPLITLNKAELQELGWSQNGGVSGGKLLLDKLDGTLVKEKSGELNIVSRLNAMRRVDGAAADAGADGAGKKVGADAKSSQAKASNKPQIGAAAQKGATDAQSAAESQLPLRLDSLLLSGNGVLSFRDESLAVPFTSALTLEKLSLTGIDSAKPKQFADFHLKGALEKNGPLEITGKVAPFLPKPAVDMTLELKNYPLKRLSSYTVQAVGTALASGQLRLNTTMKLADDTLDMKNKVVLQKLETETISKDLAAELDNQLPIPLDAALSMLRDSDRNITLNIPLQGPVSSLNVGISDVLITALSKAIVPAASGYLMYTLGPYGALAYVGMKVGEKMLQVDLPPVEFAPAEKVLTDKHRDYLARIGKILKDRPETDMQICPVVTSWELRTPKELAAIKGDDIPVVEKERPKLLELAQQRGELIRDHLEKSYSIKANRLLICEPHIDTARKTKPSVTLQM